MTRKACGWALAGVAVLAALALLTVIIRPYVSNDEASHAIGQNGGQVWSDSKSVGVQAPAGAVNTATRFSFKKANTPQPPAPIDAALEPISPAIDITPDHQVPANTADVMFKVPSRVPLNAQNAQGVRQRSIYNAAIEVYNQQLGIWVPLKTTVSGNLLIAAAPHFSLYRAVWEKVSAVTLNLGNNQSVQLALNAFSNPINLLVDTWHALGKTLYRNLFGIFDPEKFECEPKDEDHEIEGVNQGTTDKFDACVKKESSETTLVMKNGWSVPLRFWTDASPTQVHPRLITGEADIASIVKNLYGAYTGTVYASGLSVAGFDITDKAPDKFQVNGRLTLAGTVTDLTLSLLTVIFPAETGNPGFRSLLTKAMDRTIGEYRLGTGRINPARAVAHLKEIAVGKSPTTAAQAAAAMDSVNCLANVGQSLQSLKNVPGAIADGLRQCFAKELLEKVGLKELKSSVQELLLALVKETKSLPALAQLFGISVASLVHQDPTKVSFTVQKVEDDSWLQGLWSYSCAGADDSIVVKGHTGVWRLKDYTSQNTYQTYTVPFSIGAVKGKLAIKLKAPLRLFKLPAGTVIPVRRATMPHSKYPAIELKNNRISTYLYWKGNPNGFAFPSIC